MSDSEQAKTYKPSRAPDRIVNRQMMIFKEAWAGMGLSVDLGLVKGDQELAGAVWRNILGARGAQGIDYASEPTYAGKPKFRRSVNLVGGEVVGVTWKRRRREMMAQAFMISRRARWIGSPHQYRTYPPLFAWSTMNR